MRRIIYMLFVFAVIAVNVNAQQSDAERLKTFINELMSLSNEHILHEKQGFESGDVNSSVDQYLVLKTLDNLGYEAVYEILNKHEVFDNEELFGIPMAINTIDSERQIAVFMDEKNSIFVADWYKGCTVLYTNFDIIELFTQGVVMSKLGLDGFVSDIVDFGNEQVNELGQNMAVANALRKDGVAIVENGSNKKGRLQYVIDADELSIGYIEETDEFFISIPKEQFEIELKRASIYTWMQQILIPRNCKEYFSNYSLTFITPAVAMKEYMVNYLPKGVPSVGEKDLVLARAHNSTAVRLRGSNLLYLKPLAVPDKRIVLFHSASFSALYFATAAANLFFFTIIGTTIIAATISAESISTR